MRLKKAHRNARKHGGATGKTRRWVVNFTIASNRMLQIVEKYFGVSTVAGK